MSRFNGLSALLVIPFLCLVWQDDSCGRKTVKTSEETGQRVAAGVWGGPHIILTVTDDGASIVMDCADGTISQPLETDADGHFAVEGTFTAEMPGPTRQGADDSRPARYSGIVKGDSMTMTIAAAGSDEKLGTFNLAHGKQGRIWRCM